jgi:hypothetical protein
MNRILNQSLRARRVVTISTSHPAKVGFCGIVLATPKDLVVLNQVRDFEPDGFVVLPKAWIDDVRSGPFEKTQDEILRDAGAAEPASASPFAGLEHLDQIADYCHAHDVWPVVEVIYKGRASLYRGPVTDVSVHSFELFCYSAAAEWEKKYELDYEEVFKLEVESRHVRRFNAYMRKKGPPPTARR